MISSTSCSQSRIIKTTSDYCQLHDPLPNDIDPDVVKYWQDKALIIYKKNKEGGVKTTEEKSLQILVSNVAGNDKKYYDKKCPELNAVK